MVAAMIARLTAVGWCLGSLLCLGAASAQPAPAPASPTDASAALAYEPVYQPAPAPAPHKAPRPSRFRTTPYGGLDVGVPILLDVDRNLIRPGGNIHFQGGLDLGYLAFFAHGGWRGIPVDFDRAAEHGHPEYEGEGRDHLSNLYFGFGLQAQIPNRSRLLPYLSASFDFNFWHFRETAVACGGYYYWYCNDYSVYKFTPGFTGRLGTAIDLAGGVYLDVGLGMAMTFEGEFFDDKEVWLEPFLGIGFRR
jgi:hypothetical protein